MTLRFVKRLGIVAMLLTAQLAWAQPAQVGTIAGTVTDESGGVLPGVTVTITDTQRGVTRSGVTDTNGRYLFGAVPIGVYAVQAQLQGFETVQRTDNLVETEKTTAVDFALKVGALTDTVQVVGEVPIVDMTNVANNSRIRNDQFEKLPIGRSYQALIGTVPGVVGTGNVNALGALTSNNQFLIDSVDTTDPTTGTFGTNLNFEAIQEVSVSTSGASAEYGRAQGAIVSVITKSGTNRFEGSLKYIVVNDQWNRQNTTKNQVSGVSLERIKFDQVNPVYAPTLGGPIWKNHAWFFGSYERQENTTPRRQTVGLIPEDYQQTTEADYLNVRATVQLNSANNVWVKYYQAPTNGFIIDYWGAAGERTALTRQNQNAKNWAAQWSGVIRNNWTMEAAAATYESRIDVVPFETGRLFSGSPIFSLGDNRYYNGATFDGFVSRPRQQANAASTWFFSRGQSSHNIKLGVDFQTVESGARFDYPNRQLYLVDAFNQATGAIVPFARRDYESGDSTSTGRNLAVFLRDKFQVNSRFFIEAGLRYEAQSGKSDVGAITVDAQTISPRLASSYALTEDGRTVAQASYGRYYVGVVQSFSDGFAAIPQQTNYKNYLWDGSNYVFANEVRLGASSFLPNTDLKPYHMDEYMVGVQRQFGRTLAIGARFISRDWANLIDDIRTFNADRSIKRTVVNYEPAERSYRGIQFTFERRFANNWSATANYTYSRTRGNHFGTTFTSLGDYLDADCRTTVDTTIGTGGVIPCATVQDGANKFGRPGYDRPHNLKFQGAYVKPLGPVNLVLGGVADVISKGRFEKSRAVNVLFPGTTTNAGPTATYLYEPLGTDVFDGLLMTADLSGELTWRIARTYQAGFKAEVFNVTNTETQVGTSNTAWCGTTANATCSAAVTNYGKATARGQFVQPTSVRFSFIVRF